MRKNLLVYPSRTGVFLRVCESRLQNGFSRSVAFGDRGISQAGRGTGELFATLCRKILIVLRSSEGLYKKRFLEFRILSLYHNLVSTDSANIDNQSSQFHLKLRGRRTHTRGRRGELPYQISAYRILTLLLFMFKTVFAISVSVCCDCSCCKTAVARKQFQSNTTDVHH